MKKLSEILIVLLAWLTAIAGMLCLALGIYFIPFVFNLFHVDFLDHLFRFVPSLFQARDLPNVMTKLLVVAPFFVGTGLFWWISRYCSNALRLTRQDEKQETSVAAAIEKSEVVDAELNIDISDTIKVLLAVLITVIILIALEYFLTLFALV